MAGPAPKTRNWSARENVHKPSGLHLIVAGAVQVTNTNQQPQLKESAERNPKNLGLALTIEKGSGPGLEVLCWKPAHFHKEVQANEFENVTIRWDVGAIAQVPVVDDREQAQAVTVRMAALNAKAAATAKPAKKAAAKKAKKAAPKKAAKKAKKAAAKKAVTARVKKKAPKKAAKKTKGKKKKKR